MHENVQIIDKLLYRDLSYQIVGAAMEVHQCLGPGFLEAVYQKALAREFELRGIEFEAQKPLPVEYKGVAVGDYFADFIVEDKIVIEIKSVSKLNSAHEAQAHHYLAATGTELAILINFGAPSLEHKRIIRTKKPGQY
jgi:GxxExxY protein